MSCLPFSANSGQYLATGAKASTRPRSIAINAARRGERLRAGEEVDDRVLSPHGDGLRAVSVSAPDVDDEFAVDVEGDRGAQFLALGDLVGQCLGYFVESVIAVALYDVVHPAIMRRAERLRGRFESRGHRRVRHARWRARSSPAIAAGSRSESAWEITYLTKPWAPAVEPGTPLRVGSGIQQSPAIPAERHAERVDVMSSSAARGACSAVERGNGGRSRPRSSIAAMKGRRIRPGHWVSSAKFLYVILDGRISPNSFDFVNRPRTCRVLFAWLVRMAIS